MSYKDNQRILCALSAQLLGEESLSPEQSQYLGLTLHRISQGEDANHVLGVRPKKGQKTADALARQRMSFILHWIAGQVAADPDGDTKPISIEKACELAVDSIVPLAKRAFPGADNRNYSADYLARCWSAPENKHMRSPNRGFYDRDYPY